MKGKFEDFFPGCVGILDKTFACQSDTTLCVFSCNIANCTLEKDNCMNLTAYLCRDRFDGDLSRAVTGHYLEPMTSIDQVFLIEQAVDSGSFHYFRYRFGF